jgi:hypothetical protein
MSEDAGERAPRQDSVVGLPILRVGPDMAQRSPEDKVRWLASFSTSGTSFHWRCPMRPEILALQDGNGGPAAVSEIMIALKSAGVVTESSRLLSARSTPSRGTSGVEESGGVTGGQQRSLEIEGDGLRASELQDLAARLVANRNEPGVEEVRIG